MVVTLNRPAARNAIDQAMIGELHAVCDRLEAGPRPLIIIGSGGVFAGGADIAQLRDRRRGEALLGINSRLFDRIAKLPQPTVAAVAGPALGGGAELAYACDIRLAAPTARFGNPEPGLGILAAAGASWRLSELVGRSVAKQVLLGGSTLDAERALRVGLVADIVQEADLLGAAHALVDRMLRAVPLALRLTKLVLDAPGPHPVADDLAQAILFETEEKHERMTQFLERSRK
ncbi:enoyl-CoA hydratase/isomerase family protein [Nakamurella panacisegetis]